MDKAVLRHQLAQVLARHSRPLADADGRPSDVLLDELAGVAETYARASIPEPRRPRTAKPDVT